MLLYLLLFSHQTTERMLTRQNSSPRNVLFRWIFSCLNVQYLYSGILNKLEICYLTIMFVIPLNHSVLGTTYFTRNPTESAGRHSVHISYLSSLPWFVIFQTVNVFLLQSAHGIDWRTSFFKVTTIYLLGFLALQNIEGTLYQYSIQLLRHQPLNFIVCETVQGEYEWGWVWMNAPGYHLRLAVSQKDSVLKISMTNGD